MDTIQKVDRSTLTDAVSLTDSIFFERKSPQVKKVLRKKLSAVKQENQTLEDVISVKNTEIEDLKKSIQSLNEIINSSSFNDLKQNSNISNAKIFELKKKNHDLHVDIDYVKNKNMKLESKVQALEIELKKAVEKQKEPIPKKLDGPFEVLQSKLTQTKQKLFDSLNQNVELKNHLKLAQKCIQQEIGEHINLNILAAAGTNWRGRAQQILSLQLKINELKAQLENVRSKFGWSEDYPDEPPVRRDQIYHRIEIEGLKKDIEALTAHIDEQNQKIAASKARNTNLVADVTKLKEKCTNLESMGKSSDNTIATLKERLDIQKFHYENRISDLQKQITDTQKYRADFEFHREEMQIKVENLQAELERRENHIGHLNETIRKLEKDLKSICGDYLFECRDFKKEEFTGLIDALESEKNNLLALNKTMNQRLDAERMKILDLVNQISKQKIKICRLEGKIRDLEKEHDWQMEKKRRSQRISEYTSNINSNTCIVPSFVFENTSNADIPSNSCEDQSKIYEIEELRNKLEISKEKITILEDKLNYLNEEKQSDTKTFENIIKMSKSVLLDTIHQIKNKSSSELK
ncbi:coiled-coil domain-containing protein 13 [Episyrphus balteatus]|uniref:coiled-coil domain-containing protein 13 n=1 Tax=Episyrphus balteatus TaxID=286459 RepID=UPI0024858C98|nr:coiled-coil domain-containing protein 13 [Episyrphus balteatus]